MVLGNGLAISRKLPLQDGTFSGEGVSAVFENLLPDDDAPRRIIAEKTEARSAAPHDADPGNPLELDGVTQSEAEIAQTLRSLTFSPLGIEKDAPFQISLASVQEKTAYLKGNDTWLRPKGLTPTTQPLTENVDMSASICPRKGQHCF